MNKVLAVDCDGVCVENGALWLQYLLSHYKLKPEYHHLRWRLGDFKLPYNLSELFDFTGEETNGFEWWGSFDLYDNMTPRQDAIHYLKLLSEEGWDIVMVSKITGHHSHSKKLFLEKWFPFLKGIIFTAEKQYVRCDVLVDDYVVNLNKMPDGVSLYKFRRDYFQSEQPEKPMKLIYNFQELYNDLIKWEK